MEKLIKSEEYISGLIESNDLLSNQLSKLQDRLENSNSNKSPVNPKNILNQDIIDQHNNDSNNDVNGGLDYLGELMVIEKEMDNFFIQNNLNVTTKSLIRKFKLYDIYNKGILEKKEKEIEYQKEKFLALETDFVKLNKMFSQNNGYVIQRENEILKSKNRELSNRIRTLIEQNQKLELESKNSSPNSTKSGKGFFSLFESPKQAESNIMKEMQEKIGILQGELADNYEKLKETTIALQKSEEKNLFLEKNRKKENPRSLKYNEDESIDEDSEIFDSVDNFSPLVSQYNSKKDKKMIPKINKTPQKIQRISLSEYHNKCKNMLSVIDNYRQFNFILNKKIEQQEICISTYLSHLDKFIEYFNLQQKTKKYFEDSEEEEREKFFEKRSNKMTPQKMRKKIRQFELEKQSFSENLYLIEDNVSKMNDPSLYLVLDHEELKKNYQEKESFWKERYMKLAQKIKTKKPSQISSNSPKKRIGTLRNRINGNL